MKKNIIIFLFFTISSLQFSSCNKKEEKLEQPQTKIENPILDEYHRLERILSEEKGYYYSDNYGGDLKFLVFTPRTFSETDIELFFPDNSISERYYFTGSEQTDPFQFVKKYQINIENDRVLSLYMNSNIYTRVDVEKDDLLDFFREKANKTMTSFIGLYIDSRTSRKYSLLKNNENYILYVEYPEEMNLENVQEEMYLEKIGKFSGETFSIYYHENYFTIYDPVINQSELYDHDHDEGCKCGGDIIDYEVRFTLDDKVDSL